MKRFLLVLITICVIAGIPAFPTVAYGAAAPPEIIAEAGFVIDTKSGTVVYSKNENSVLEPASTTKIMTCILALEHLKLDQVITVDAESPFTTGTRIYVIEGEELTVEQLVYALMVESANDAATVLAKAVAGSVEEFAAMMNAKAKELGANNTHFANANGLPAEGHVTTARDLAIIATEAMKSEKFREIVSTPQYTIPPTNKQPEARILWNSNRMLHDKGLNVVVNGVNRKAVYEGTIGIKTGYTAGAGGCLVAQVERDGTSFMSVIMKSTSDGRFADSIALMDYAFDTYYSHQAVLKGEGLGTIKVRGGVEKEVTVKPAKDYSVTLPKEASSSVITTEVVLDEKVKAPVKKGQKVGVINILEGGEKIAEVDAVAAKAVESGALLTALGVSDKAARIIYVVVCVVMILLFNLFMITVYFKQKQKRRKRALREKRALELAMARKEKNKEYEQRGWPY